MYTYRYLPWSVVDATCHLVVPEGDSSASIQERLWLGQTFFRTLQDPPLASEEIPLRSHTELDICQALGTTASCRLLPANPPVSCRSHTVDSLIVFVVVWVPRYLHACCHPCQTFNLIYFILRNKEQVKNVKHFFVLIKWNFHLRQAYRRSMLTV